MEDRNDKLEMEERIETTETGEYNASFDPDPEPILSDDELQDTILEDSGMNSFQKFIQAG